MFHFLLLLVISYAYCNTTDNLTTTGIPGNSAPINTTTYFTYNGNGLLTIYNILSTQGNYFEATQMCNSKQMKLLSIESREENQLIFDKLQSGAFPNDFRVWTSGTVLADEPKYTWLSTGKDIEFFAWQAGQPNYPAVDEKCISAYFDPRKLQTLFWDDWPCNANFYIVCESSVQIFN